MTPLHKISLFGLILLFMLSGNLQGQSAMYNAREYWNGSSLNLGIHQTRFFNNNFESIVANEDLLIRAGAQVGLSLISYPFIFDVTFFHSAYSATEGLLPTYEKPSISHSGGEFAVNLALLPQLKFIQPTIGVGYQAASVGINLSDEEAGRSGVSLSTPIYKFGLQLKVKKIGLRAEYKRSYLIGDYNPNRRFYQFGLSVSFDITASMSQY